MTAMPTARALNANALQELIVLPAHGFHAGQVVIYNSAWALSKSDTLAHCAGSMMVSIVPSVNSFYVTQIGEVSGLSTAFVDGGVIISGIQYYVSPTTAGNLTSTKPTTSGNAILPCMIFESQSNGFFFGGAGEEILPPTLSNWSVVTVDTLMVPNQGYFVNSAGNVNMTIPTVFNRGDTFEIAMINTGTFTIVQQNAPAQQILVLGGSTTVGAGGSILSVDLHARVNLTGYIANTVLHCDPDGSIDIT